MRVAEDAAEAHRRARIPLAHRVINDARDVASRFADRDYAGGRLMPLFATPPPYRPPSFFRRQWRERPPTEIAAWTLCTVEIEVFHKDGSYLSTQPLYVLSDGTLAEPYESTWGRGRGVARFPDFVAYFAATTAANADAIVDGMADLLDRY